jgi:hypothetical protein
MSALTLAKTSVDDDRRKIPVKLGDAVRQSLGHADQAQRKRALAVVEWFWKDTLGYMRKLGLPIKWPQKLGGWGMPGSQNASVKFRKFAAILMGMGEDERPKLAQMLSNQPRSKLDGFVDKTIVRIMERMSPVRILERATGGVVKRMIVPTEDEAVHPLLATEGRVKQARGWKRNQSRKRAAKEPQAVEEVNEFNFNPLLGAIRKPEESVIDIASYAVGERERSSQVTQHRWAGIPKHKLKVKMKTRLKSAIQQTTYFQSHEPTTAGVEKRDPLSSNVTAVVRAVRRVIAMRPGVNPIARRNAEKAGDEDHKNPVLYSISDVRSTCDVLHMPDIVENIYLDCEGVPPNGCRMAQGDLQYSRVWEDEGPLGSWGAEQQVGWQVEAIDSVKDDVRKPYAMLDDLCA